MSASYTANIWIALKKYDLSDLNSYVGVQSNCSAAEKRKLKASFLLSYSYLATLRQIWGVTLPAGQWGLKAALARWEAGDTGWAEERWAGLSHGLLDTAGP